MTDEPLQFGGSPHRLRGWLLFILRETARLGIPALDQETLHLLLFYAAVLTPVHGLDNPVPKILKYRDRPFYPEAQDELTRLIANGFVVGMTRASIGDDGWETDRYEITEYGVRVTTVLLASRWGGQTSSFVRDLVSSFAELDPSVANGIIDQDAVYREDRLRRGQIADLRTSNYATQAARMVADYEVDGVRPDPRDSLALYFNFLQARRAA
jgi:hypothetical protein